MFLNKNFIVGLSLGISFCMHANNNMTIVRDQTPDTKLTTLNIDTTQLAPTSVSIATKLKDGPVALVKVFTREDNHQDSWQKDNPEEESENSILSRPSTFYHAPDFVTEFKNHPHNMNTANKTWIDPYSEKIIIDLVFYGIKDENSTVIYHPLKSRWYRAFYLQWYKKSLLTNIKDLVCGLVREVPGCLAQEMRDAKKRKLSQNIQQLGSSTQEFWLFTRPKKSE